MKTIALLFAAVLAAEAQAAFDRFFDEYYFRYQPTAATSAGFHQYDTKLEDYSRASVHERVRALRRFEHEFERLPGSADRDLVLGHIRAELLELISIRSWRKNPDLYSSGVSNSAFVIMSRKYAPPAQRLEALIARERQMPRVFDEARLNLHDPPKVYTEIALEQLPGIVSFFEKETPKAFEEVHDRTLLARFAESNGAVIRALKGYESFLKNDLLPRSNGDFRIGAESYRKKLRFEEMVDLPLENLLRIGYENLRQNQREFQRLAGGRNPQQVLQELEKQHPAPADLMQTFRDVLAGLRDFIVQHKIVTLPGTELPILEETPPFMRALTFASMDTPGPFEKVAKEAFFNVTLPEPGWRPKQVEEHMEGFHRGTIISTAIHEAYPGHYVQFLWLQHAPSKTRKLLGAASNSEGWAHYCEQMMLDQGYGGGDVKLRLGQLQDALLRNARYIAGILMHTRRMTFDQAVDFFVREGYQTRANALREAKRGTSDPTYLVYTLGKLEILKLREDYRKLHGDRFSLQEFHDTFLKQGFPPVRLIRQVMLGNDSPVL